METASLSFGEPSWFAALAILPVITLLLWWANRRNKLLLQQVVALRLFDQLVGSISRRQQSIRTALLLGSLALLIITLARPRLGASPIKTLQEGRDIIVAVDISRSMLAVDSAPNRLTHAKFFVQDFADFLQGDRLGLITFSGIAFLQIPLTTDYAAVANGVKELDTNFIPRGGTNIASAIRVARKTFGHFSGVVRALILVSDGEELEGRAVIEAKRAASQGIRIYTVGIGTTGGSLLPIAAARAGEQDLVRSTDGKPVTSYLDAAHLKEIAETTGGFYCPFKPFSSAQRIFHKGILPSLVAREGQASISSRPVERFEWTLIPAILLLSTWWLTGNRKGNVFQGRPTILFLDLVLLAVLSTVTSINAAQNGLESYRRGDYQKALKDFESYLQKRPNLAEASFDAGTAAYKLGDYDKALNFFGKAILGKSVQLRVSAQYNMGNSLVRKGEASPSDDQKRAQWKAAIQQYDQVLRQKPKNRAAADNRQLVQKMLKEQEQKETRQEQKETRQEQKETRQEQKETRQEQKETRQEQKETRQEQKETRQEQNLHSGVSPALFSIASKSDRNEKAGGREKSFSHRKTVPSVSLTKEQANVLIDSMKEDEQHFEVHGQDFSQDIYRNW